MGHGDGSFVPKRPYKKLTLTFARLFRLDTDKHGVSVSFAVNDGLSLGVNLDGLDVLDFPYLFNDALNVAFSG
ncbi:MAG: hypothetical protein IKW85_10850 [Muribaculaceae bacterium]|nr:hypothetical protein [Muribaculaceae bacterium]